MERAVSVGTMYRERVPGHGARPALMVREGKRRWKTLSWEEADRDVRALALALDALGLKKGDALAILSGTRAEWTLLDLAAVASGLVVVGIYQSNVAATVEYILRDSEAVVCFVEDHAQREKVEAALPRLPRLKHVFGIRSDAGASGSTYSDLLAKGRALLASSPRRFDQLLDRVVPEDLATLVYTSGTTGEPKGAMLTHANLTAICEATRGLMDVRPGDRTVLFLPLAHIFARTVQFQCAERGATIAYPPYGATPETLFECFREAKPTFLGSVPRIFEKVHAAVNARLASGGPLSRTIVDFALSTGRERSQRVRAGKPLGAVLGLRDTLADLLLYRKVKAQFGGKIRFFVSGGAPLSREIAEWFHAMDLLVLEGYGLTETTAATCLNRIDRYRLGSVGPPVPGTEVRIADDGEILIKGPGVFRGYWKRPEDSAQVLSREGWFASGDIGHLDPDGFLVITDRKKDLIVTAGGKNIAPAYVESKLKTLPLVSQVMVHGDRRKFLSALFTLSPDEVKKLGLSYEEAVKSRTVRERLEKDVAEVNQSLESFQQVKRFAVAPRDFSVEDGTLTPTLKVKRKVVTDRYKPLLDALYQESDAA